MLLNTKIGLNGARKSAICVQEPIISEPQNLLSKLKFLENEYEKLNSRILQVKNPNYLKELKSKISILNQRLKTLDKTPTKNLDYIDFKAEYGLLEDKSKELDIKIQQNAKKIEDLDNLYSEVQIELKVSSEEAKEINGNFEEKSFKIDSPRQSIKTKSGLVSKLIKTRHTVALGDYNQIKLKLRKQIEESKEILLEKAQLCELSCKEICDLQEKINSLKRKTQIYEIIPENLEIQRIPQKIDISSKTAELNIKEYSCAKKIQRKWRNYLKNKTDFYKVHK